MVGVRAGAITAACDKVKVTLAGPGGHTARPHLTADVVYALGKIVTEVPAALTRRVDPRAGLSLVWGQVSAGSAANAIPDDGVVEGTVRCLDAEVWRSALALVEDLVQSVAVPYGVTAKVEYLSAVPPTVNEPASAALIASAAAAVLGPDAVDRDAAEPRRRGLRVVPAPGARAPWPGSAPARRARSRPAISTSRPLTSTSGRSASASACWRRSPPAAMTRYPHKRPSTRVSWRFSLRLTRVAA